MPDRLEPRRPGAALARGAGPRIAPGHPRDGEAEQPRRHDARQNAGREELADIGLGHDAVDHHDHRRRDQDAERAARGNGTGGERVLVAELAHRRVGHLGEGRGGGDRRAADRPEARARDDGGHGEAAALVAEEGVGGVVELLGHARAHDEIAHEDEQRDHRQGIREAGLVGGLRDHRRRRAEIHLQGEAEETHDPHGEGHRDPKESKQQKGGEPEQSLGHASGPSASPGMWRCGRRTSVTSKATAVSAMRMAIA